MTRANTSLLALAAAGAGVYLAARAIRRGTETYDLHGRTVLITGGSRGLGLVLGREFVRQGARVAICARDIEELERASADLVRPGAPVIAVPCDVTNYNEVEEMVQNVRQHLGRIDILVNNAGTIEVGPLETMTLTDFEEAMKTNYSGALHAILAVIPGMRERGEGRIVNITSIGGKVAIPHLTPYTASKFALVGLSKAMRAELDKDNILVTTVCPGLMRTGSPRNAVFKGQHRAEYTWFSIGDSLPLVSISAESAARRIIAACRRGEAEVIFPIQAKLAALCDALFPELSADLAALANRLLPAPGGIGTGKAKGRDSESSLSPSVLTVLGDQAARRNNEYGGYAA
ncbi:MAG TPA: SDR family NAD(P)-dependent oxidoreductase [Blastocatellia bacterium]|nr:SDR family NAD(P)-dependent oxidoreductase [Blastocatellia bacterium]